MRICTNTLNIISFAVCEGCVGSPARIYVEALNTKRPLHGNIFSLENIILLCIYFILCVNRLLYGGSYLMEEKKNYTSFYVNITLTIYAVLVQLLHDCILLDGIVVILRYCNLRELQEKRNGIKIIL